MSGFLSFNSKIAHIAAGAVIVSVMILSATPVSAQRYSEMSCGELWYARNAIFAEKGFCFNTWRAIRVFGRRCYPPYGRLNRWERRQVNRIENWEYRKGCR